MGRIKYSCYFLILKPDERCLLRKTHMFQGLDTVVTHIKRSGNNLQSCITAGNKNLQQEINKHLTPIISLNQAVSYWLVALVIQTMQLEDHGMICNIACPPMVSKVLKAHHTAKLMNGTQFLSDWYFIKHETKHTIFIAHLKSAHVYWCLSYREKCLE